MAQADLTGSLRDSGREEGRERGARRKKVYGYIKAANELRQSYQSQWAQSRNQDEFEDEQGIPGAFPDVEVVRSGEEEMVLFPSYARKRVKNPEMTPHRKPGAQEDIAHPASSGDAEYWKTQWEKYEDENAIVDIDVRGWIYTPHKGAITRKNRLLIAVARKLSGLPSPSPVSSRDSSRHSTHRERLGERAARHEEEAAAREAQSLVQRGEGEADAAWRGSYSEDPSRTWNGESPFVTRSSSPVSLHEHSCEPLPGNITYTGPDASFNPDSDDPAPGSLAKRSSWNRPANMSKEELARANSHLMTRLKPFMHLPLVSAPITVFFFNDRKSQSRSINTNESGHFTLRASLEFEPTSIRVLASENLSATEKITITDPRGVSLVSDIDDTIKHSAIAGGAKEIFNNTFIRELGDLTIKGVKEWYSKLAALGIRLHYVSNSPWQLYPLLRSYFALAGLPPGSFHLKQYSGMLQGIFEPAAERKKGSLEKIMRDFPERQFILVGDSGEADLEVYTDVVMANPGRILGVFIRDVTTPQKKGFFDQSGGQSHVRPDTSAENNIRQGSVLKQSDGSEDFPSLSSRKPSATTTSEGIEHPVGDLIDFDEDIEEQNTHKASHHKELRELEESQQSPKSPPPTRPPKPPSLRSPSNTQVRSTNQERSISTTSHQNSTQQSPSPTRGSGPPPKPRRSSTSVNVEQRQRVPFSSDHQNQNRRSVPLRPTSPKPPGYTQGDEGYTTSARRHLVSAYNILPSPRDLWSSSPHTVNSSSTNHTQANPSSSHTGYPDPTITSLASSRPSTRRQISSAAHSFASNRLSWSATGAGGGDPAAGGNGGAPPGSSYNKKEEVWRRRWARAEEVMRREGVMLRTWRVGADVMDECVGLCEKALERIEKDREKGSG